ncbi:MAG: Gmad2 immunoglobulin-like domain-containing protein [bacterium]
MDKKIVIIIVVIILLIVGGIFTIMAFDWLRLDRGMAVDFEDCVKSGFAVTESYPKQCTDRAGKTFTEEAGNMLIKANIITLTAPRPKEEITSPVKITGQARGLWFFEGSFPVKLKTVDGKTLSYGVVKSGSDWMTDDFVNFEAIMNFSVATRTQGYIELIKDNPSGMTEKDDALFVPVVFMPKISDNIK